MTELSDIKVIDLGGSLVVPDRIDTEFLKAFACTLTGYLSQDEARKIILVCGGGTLAREYQKAYREVAAEPQNEAQDWIGITATRLNAELLKQVFSSYCPLPVITDPTDVTVFAGRILVAGGWKPGFSTDYDAVVLAGRFSADAVIDLSDIPMVYTDDPKKNPEAEPIDKISWADFRAIIGDKWVPGINSPFDPIAAALAAENRIKVIVADGRNIENLGDILEDREFEGTVIGPD